ncbi:MAG: FMN-binding protein [Ruminococcaceae bacterium]|nr:FMN-binding protein [Oscillospiraceae bacterium]
MSFKRIISVVLIAVAVVMSLAGCGKKKNNSSGAGDAGSVKYKDGEYLASSPTYDDQGFMATVKVIVKDGQVASIDCDALAKEGDSKKVQSENGNYSMKPAGAKYEWYEQIAFFEQHVKEKGVESVNIKDDQKTDTVTGCTIKVKEYVDLIKEALNRAKM